MQGNVIVAEGYIDPVKVEAIGSCGAILYEKIDIIVLVEFDVLL